MINFVSAQADGDAGRVVARGVEYEGFFTPCRIRRETVPCGWSVYDMRGSVTGEGVSELRNGTVLLNFCGSFCTQNPLPLEPDASLSCRNGEFELVFA